jgi:hypothetical protein
LPGGGISNGVIFVIKSGPTISVITPSTKQAGSGAFTLTVTGTSYYSGSKVRWNGADRITTYTTSTQLTLRLSLRAILHLRDQRQSPCTMLIQA